MSVRDFKGRRINKGEMEVMTKRGRRDERRDKIRDGDKERGGGQSVNAVNQRNELACSKLTVPALLPVSHNTLYEQSKRK